jgi:eukaryotic-like serine/threonine-protein kinase
MAAALAPALGAVAEPTLRIEPIDEAEPSQRIDRYKILQKLGEGGCGVVYMAEQTEPVRRMVALKIIKLGMDTRQVISRFEAERQALALMDHPNIAKVLDAGATETGRPYFVMELVKGIRITDYCDQNRLATPERLALFTQVCQAIQHAHQKGIIHRDIKPSNILVTLHDGVPVPKVIDFGIAKATEQPLTDKTVFTAFGQFMGTPAYMSPEQAELSGLDIDTRSDIYALGVLLYELLTGRTPFDAKELLQAGLDEMRRRIREEEPMRPSTRLSTMVDADLTEVAQRRQSVPAQLTRFIRGDLDWIVMKCLEKDRTRRYETANGLTMDLRRHLNNEPVVACPPSHFYRFQKAIQRNKLAFGAALLVACSLVFGLSLSTWMYLREKQARQEAIVRAQSERKAKEAETTSRKQAQAVSDYLVSALRSPDPARDGRTITIAEVLDRDARELQDKFADDPRTKATLLMNIAWAYSSSGLIIRSIPLFEQAFELRNRYLGAQDDETVQAKQSLALHYWIVGQTTKALPLAEEVYKARQEKFGSDYLYTLTAQFELGKYYSAAGRSREGQDMMARAFKALNAKLGPDHPEIFWHTTAMADMYRSLGRTREALALDEPLLKFRRAKMGNDHPDTLHSMRAVAQDYIELGRLDDAAALLQDTVKLSTTRLGPDHSQTLSAKNNLAEVLRRQSKLAEAQEILQGGASAGGQAKKEGAAITASSPQAGGQAGAPKDLTEPPSEPDERVNAFVRNGQWREAALELAKAIELVPSNHSLYLRRGEILGRIGLWSEAAASLRQSIDSEPTNSWPHFLLAPILLFSGDVQGYRQHCQRIVARFAETTDAGVADTMAKACLIYPASGVDLGVVAELAEKAVALGKQSEYLPWFEMCKGLAEYRQDHFAGAADWAQKALASSGQLLERDACAYLVVAMAQMQLKQGGPARVALAKAGEVVDGKIPKLDCGDLGVQWIDVVIANILMREATALINDDREQGADAANADH